MKINLSGIKNKLEAYVKSDSGKLKIASTLQEMREDDLEQTAGGSLIISKNRMGEIGDELIKILQQSANDAGFAASAKSVLEHFDNISKGELIKEKDGSYRYDLTFEGKTDGRNSVLAREPLENDDVSNMIDDKDKLQNIVALFNNGYSSGKPRNFAYGLWYGHKPTTLDTAYRTGGYDSDDVWTRSTLDRPAMHFMQRAVEDFNAKYEKKYGIRAVLSEEYTDPNYYNR